MKVDGHHSPPPHPVDQIILDEPFADIPLLVLVLGARTTCDRPSNLSERWLQNSDTNRHGNDQIQCLYGV